MDLSNVTLDDGRRLAALVQLLKAGRWDLSGAEAEELVRVKLWVQELATKMVPALKSPPTPAPSQEAAPAGGGFKVKSMGQLPTKARKGRKAK